MRVSGVAVGEFGFVGWSWSVACRPLPPVRLASGVWRAQRQLFHGTLHPTAGPLLPASTPVSHQLNALKTQAPNIQADYRVSILSPFTFHLPPLT